MGGIPKSLIDVGGKPFIHWQLQLPFSDFVVCLGAHAEAVRDVLPSHVRVCQETEPLGTAGALWNCRHLWQEKFVMLYGDVLLPSSIAFSMFFGDMAVLEVPGNVTKKGYHLTYGEPGPLLDAGALCLSNKALLPPKGDLSDWLPNIILRPFYVDWCHEVGSISGLQRLRWAVEAGRIRFPRLWDKDHLTYAQQVAANKFLKEKLP
jgi:hypothetical protein